MNRVSVQKYLQLHFLGLLKANAEELAVDDRTIYISGEIPDDRFSTKTLPRVVVGMPRIISRDSYTAHKWRVEVAIPFLVCDGANVTHQKRQNQTNSDEDRIELIANKLITVLDNIDNHCLGQFFQFNHFSDWEEGEDIEEFSNNIFGKSIVLSLPIIYERDYEFKDGYAYGFGTYDYFDVIT